MFLFIFLLLSRVLLSCFVAYFLLLNPEFAESFLRVSQGFALWNQL